MEEQNGEPRLPRNKEELLQWVQASHDKLEGVLARLGHDEMVAPVLEGGRSIKDVMSHLTAWEQHTLDRMEARNDAGELERVLAPEEQGLDNQNAEFFSLTRDLPLPEVRRKYNETHSRLIEYIEALPEQEIFESGHHLLRGGDPLLYLIGGNTLLHYDEHRQQIESYLEQANSAGIDQPGGQDSQSEAPADKAQMLTIIHEAHTRLVNSFASLSPQQMEAQVPGAEWSAKEYLAHVTLWEQLCLRLLEALNTGSSEIPPDLNMASGQVDKINAEANITHKQQTLEQVMEAFSRSYAEIVGAIEATPEQKLLGPSSPTWFGNQPTWELIACNTYQHYVEHAEIIERGGNRETENK